MERVIRAYMQIRLNPVTLITGAGAGIGAGCAHELARKSHGGLILADRDESALALLADELDAAGASPERVSTLAFDPTDADRWRQAIEFIQSQYGRLDWVVVNAPAPMPSAEPPSDLVDLRRRVMPDSLDAAVAALRAVLPLLRKNTQGGSIVVTAPSDALNVEPGSTTRAGLSQLVQAAAVEGAHDNIRVNAIAPGGAQTPAWDAMPWFHDIAREAGSDSAAFDRISRMKPALARYAAGGDVRRLIVMLIAEEAPISGATLVVDGGATL